ncbi:MAG: prolipoprotein diacylglyceryl transferase [Xanthomonadaceae bacterium]|nr:prolipoprotein diacylglyceryl transferase [Xanthomonadaceae bacterium]
MLIHWQFDPIALQVGPVPLRWYGLLFVGGFFIGQRILARIFRREDVPEQHADALLMYALIGAVVGARIVHCLFYEPDYYLSNPLAILRIWEGGLASHGGVIGVVVGMWMASRRLKLPFAWLLDRMAIPSALVAVFIRVANFLNSEIVGNPTGGQWGVVFEAVDALPRHPAQLYEAFGYLLTFFVLRAIYKRHGAETPRGLLLGWMLALVFGVRILVEFVKTPQAAYEAGQLISVGQWLSVPFLILGIVLIARARRPATLGA